MHTTIIYALLLIAISYLAPAAAVQTVVALTVVCRPTAGSDEEVARWGPDILTIGERRGSLADREKSTAHSPFQRPLQDRIFGTTHEDVWVARFLSDLATAGSGLDKQCNRSHVCLPAVQANHSRKVVPSLGWSDDHPQETGLHEVTVYERSNYAPSRPASIPTPHAPNVLDWEGNDLVSMSRFHDLPTAVPTLPVLTVKLPGLQCPPGRPGRSFDIDSAEKLRAHIAKMAKTKPMQRHPRWTAFKRGLSVLPSSIVSTALNKLRKNQRTSRPRRVYATTLRVPQSVNRTADALLQGLTAELGCDVAGMTHGTQVLTVRAMRNGRAWSITVHDHHAYELRLGLRGCAWRIVARKGTIDPGRPLPGFSEPHAGAQAVVAIHPYHQVSDRYRFTDLDYAEFVDLINDVTYALAIRFRRAAAE